MTRNAARSQGRSLVVRGQTSSACSPPAIAPAIRFPKNGARRLVALLMTLSSGAVPLR